MWYEHTWRGLHKHCRFCYPLQPLVPKVLGYWHYGWCQNCSNAQICNCCFRRAPWPWLLRKIRGLLYVYN